MIFEPADHVDLRHFTTRDECELLHDVTCFDGDETVKAPAGMPTDGGSKPRVSWRVAGHPYQHRTLLAYVIHDAECAEAKRIWAAGEPERARAVRLKGDDRFGRALRHLGDGRAMAAIKRLCVRAQARWSLRGRPRGEKDCG